MKIICDSCIYAIYCMTMNYHSIAFFILSKLTFFQYLMNTEENTVSCPEISSVQLFKNYQTICAKNAHSLFNENIYAPMPNFSHIAENITNCRSACASSKFIKLCHINYIQHKKTTVILYTLVHNRFNSYTLSMIYCVIKNNAREIIMQNCPYDILPCIY